MSSALEQETTLGLPQTTTESDRQPIGSAERGLATASMFGAVLVSTCCIVPLLLVTLGVSGAWIGNLTALEPYKPYFLTGTAILLGLGFWHVYFKPKKVRAEGSSCARPISGRITKAALWIATVLALLAATVNFWAPVFY